MVGVLIAGGGDPRKRALDGETPLHRTARHGHDDCLRMLLAAVVALETQERATEGERAITEAAGRILHIQNENGSCALHSAVEMNRAGCAAILLDAGVDLHARDDEGNTLLHIALNAGFVALAADLLTRGARADAVNRHGSTPLELAERRMAHVQDWLDQPYEDD